MKNEVDSILKEIDSFDSAVQYIRSIRERLAVLSIKRINYLPAREEINAAILLLRDAARTIEEIDSKHGLNHG